MRLEFDILANGRLHKATVTVRGDDGGPLTTDKADMVSMEDRRRLAKRLARRLQKDPEEVQAKVEEAWGKAYREHQDRQAAQQAAARRQEPPGTCAILDADPDVMRRPLCLVNGRGYAAAWLHVQTTITQGLDPQTGALVTYNPPQVRTVPVLAVARDDGVVFVDGPAVLPGTRPLADLGLEVRLPFQPQPERCWSGAGFKRFQAGERPDPAAVFDRLVSVVDRFMDFSRSFAGQGELCELTACYVLATYLLDAFNVVGYLWPNGDRGTGKTNYLVVVCEVAYLGQVILAGGSYASLRDLADYGATLAFDDAEGVMDVRKSDPDKRALLLAGNRRGATVTVKEQTADKTWATRHVSTFCPRLFSAIGLPDDVLASRTVIVPLVRSADVARSKAKVLITSGRVEGQYGLFTPTLEPRLQRRYRQLVLEHLHVSDPLAAGIHALAVPGLADGFAAVLGAHRILGNDAVTLPRLIEPLHHLARRWRQQAPGAWGLVMHDWSLLSYPTHRRKTDQAKVNNGRGYELATLLLVEGGAGEPVTPLELRLRSARAAFSTRAPAPGRGAFRIDEVLPSMQAVADLGLGGPLVHVLDREADALAQYRAWQAAGQHFLVRANGTRKVRWQGEEVALADLAGRLPLRRCREVTYQGRAAVQHVAEAEVVLDRPAWRKRRRGRRAVNERVPGPPLALRLVVSRVCDATGRTLAVWYLLTNVPAEVDTATVALWYYWRWRIESLFKLLKGAGHQVEHWKQPHGGAIAKRLLVAAMACALVWRLERHPAAEAADLRRVLVRLSGRPMRWGREATAPALLAGLWVLLAMLAVLDEHSVEELRRLKNLALGTAEDDSG
jgi:hypothetical protein